MAREGEEEETEEEDGRGELEEDGEEERNGEAFSKGFNRANGLFQRALVQLTGFFKVFL